jgi:hypothetical protein
MSRNWRCLINVMLTDIKHIILRSRALEQLIVANLVKKYRAIFGIPRSFLVYKIILDHPQEICKSTHEPFVTIF